MIRIPVKAWRYLALAAGGLLAAMAARAEEPCTLLHGGTLYLPGGDVRAGNLRIEGSRIAGVGVVEVGGCEVIDATGLHVTAGMIEVASQIGLVEVSLEDATVDSDAGGPRVRAAFQVADAYNPRSTLVPIQRMGGITSALIVPGGGMIAGQSAHVRLAGSTQEETLLNESVAMNASLGATGSLASSLALLAEVLDDARAFARNRSAWERNASRPYSAGHLDLLALGPVLAGDIPLVIGANQASDIEAVLRFAAEQGVRVVVDGAAEGWLVAEQLAAAKVPVIIDPYVYGPGSWDQVNGRPDNGALLVQAGVEVVIATHSSHNARLLYQAAGNAVRGGMSHADALDAVTGAPARVFGLQRRGELVQGAVADVVVWGGDPLELGSGVRYLFIDGRPVVLESRQTLLYERYRDLPGSPLPGLPLPPE